MQLRTLGYFRLGKVRSGLNKFGLTYLFESALGSSEPEISGSSDGIAVL